MDVYSVNLLEHLNSYIDEFCAKVTYDLKANVFKRMLNDYRLHHSIDAKDPEYYGLVLLDAIVSYINIAGIVVSHHFDINEPCMLHFLARTSKNDNIILRMVAHYFVCLSLNQLEDFEVWVQPLDHT